MKKTILLLTIVLIGIGYGTFRIFQNQYQRYLATPVDKNSTARIVVNVESGETGKDIAKKLDQLGLIPSRWAFYWYIKRSQMDFRLEAGKFILKKSMTIPEIAEALLHGRSEEVVVIIREGLTIDQVDQYLTDQLWLPSGMFSQCAKTCVIEENFKFLHSRPAGQSLEGYLFPDTYFEDPEKIIPKSLIMRMLWNFDAKLTPEFRSAIANSGYSIHQIATMASLIEKESRKSEEKPIIAGILWKRFKEKLSLDVDATVRYALNKWTEPLTLQDLAINSPYNTRKRVGLPPGPISNFGLESLKAAIYPEKSPYYFYLHDAEGNIHYAKTNKEHNENKRKFL